ncbi:hypothetical protein KAU45_07935 [bacterium]|nr:hypothetical protein [bacterium]
MKKTLFVMLVFTVSSVPAQDPENVIIKYDSAFGGHSITGAIDGLWPDCYCETFDGGTWPEFIAALTSGDWDMCVVAADNYTTFNTGHYQALTDYYNDHEKLYYYNWYAHGSYDSMLESATGVGNPGSMGFTSSHYVWDAGHDIVQDIDPWTLDMHGWGFGVYHHRYPWTSAHPVTGWSASESTGQAGFLEAENGVGVMTGLYASYIGGGQEQALWENVLNFIWGGEPDIEPPWVEGMDPDDGEIDVPVDTTIVFHCVDLLSSVELDTIDFSARDTSLSDGRAVSASATLSVAHDSTRSIAGELDIDDTDPKNVVCTFTPYDPLYEDDTITCTVAGGPDGLADSRGNYMEEDWVWIFDTEVAVEDTTWGQIKAEY